MPRPFPRLSLLPAVAAFAAACADPVVAPSPALMSEGHVLHEMSSGYGALGTTTGGTEETFDLYTSDQSTWLKAPVNWNPIDPVGPVFGLDQPTNPAFTNGSALRGWTIVKQVRDRAAWQSFAAMEAWHALDNCAAPPAHHTVDDYSESVFFCRNHMMTAVNAPASQGGYGVTYLTPNRMVDLSSGTATVSFDVATLRETANDWIDLWITPYEHNLVAPLDDNLPDLQGEPRRGIHIRMSQSRNASIFRAYVITNHQATELMQSSSKTYEQAFAEYALTSFESHNGAQSATRRDKFVLEIANGTIKFGMPKYNLWWVNTSLPALDWNVGVVQIGHHSFDPTGPNCDPTPTACGPTTWHWDNISVSPSKPLYAINAIQRFVEPSSTIPEPAVEFPAAAPEGASLRFAGYGEKVEVSFDGVKWDRATRQAEELDVPNRFHSYWTPIPAGAKKVWFRAKFDPTVSNWNKNRDEGMWMVRDIAIWSR